MLGCCWSAWASRLMPRLPTGLGLALTTKLMPRLPTGLPGRAARGEGARTHPWLLLSLLLLLLLQRVDSRCLAPLADKRRLQLDDLQGLQAARLAGRARVRGAAAVRQRIQKVGGAVLLLLFVGFQHLGGADNLCGRRHRRTRQRWAGKGGGAEGTCRRVMRCDATQRVAKSHCAPPPPSPPQGDAVHAGAWVQLDPPDA